MDEGISNLPSPILHHILSFLSRKEAVQTCVLSKSWRHLVSSRPNFSLYDVDFSQDKEKFMDVLERSLQVYYDLKLCIEEFRVWTSLNPGIVLLLENWIPKVVVKKFHLSFHNRVEKIGVPSAVFASEFLQELYLLRCNLSKINSIGNNHHLKTLVLQYVCIEDESFAKFFSSCSSIERLSLRYCKGLRTINMHDHHNLKRFKLESEDDDDVDDGSIEIYLPSTIERINISYYPNWYQHRNYFPGLTRLVLILVPLSNEWFNSFSRNFPCLEDLRLWNCNGFDEFQLSSRSIKKLDIRMYKSTNKATIDTPNIINFHYDAYISQSIYINTITSREWNAQIDLKLNLDASQWFRKLTELVAAFSRSQITLTLIHSYEFENRHIEHFSDISIRCGSYKLVAMKSLYLELSGRYYDFFFSDLVIGLFRFVRPREIKQFWKDEFLCRTLQKMGTSEDEGMNFWQQDLEEVSLEVKNGTEWHPVQEYVAALHRNYVLRFQLKWRE